MTTYHNYFHEPSIYSRLYLHRAFDTVWDEGLLYKLKENKIGRKVFTVIKDMYSCCQSSVKNDNMYSDFF
jgi:hypothetical protein